MQFVSEFTEFIEQEDFGYERPERFLFSFPASGLKLQLVPLSGTAVFVPDGRKYLYEDVWRRGNAVMRERIKAHLGRFHSVFARNCKVVRLDTPDASAFLTAYHSYGYARSKYRYGLRDKEGSLIAVASFSAGRPMPRNDAVLQSFEWVRYASLPDTRVVGGMGKLMNAFIEDIHPQEIMSYADLEWSDGAVYRSLGFVEAGRREPVDFLVDISDWKRYSIRKLECDNSFKTKALETESLVRISNMGSIKYLKTI